MEYSYTHTEYDYIKEMLLEKRKKEKCLYLLFSLNQNLTDCLGI